MITLALARRCQPIVVVVGPRGDAVRRRLGAGAGHFGVDANTIGRGSGQLGHHLLFKGHAGIEHSLLGSNRLASGRGGRQQE